MEQEDYEREMQLVAELDQLELQATASQRREMQHRMQRDLADGTPQQGALPTRRAFEEAVEQQPAHEEGEDAYGVQDPDLALRGTGGMDEDKNVRVAIRIRPPLQHELEGRQGIPFHATTRVSPDQRNISLVDPANVDDRSLNHGFAFDHVFDTGASQRQVYDTTVRQLVSSCLEGYNATILAYGQTGTGKTYTMEGPGEERFQDRGIVPRAIEQVFSHIQEKASASNRFLVRASYLQIYNDVIYDLLKPDNQNLQIREDDKAKQNNRGVYVDGLSEWVVRSPQEIFKLMASGAALRATGKTKLNELSSRSHAILKLIIEQCETSFVDPTGRSISAEAFEALLQSEALGGATAAETSRLIRQRFRIAKLNLVDLAGSERVRVSGATGQRLEESKRINRSLSALGNVISALTDRRSRAHIPYRDSKLTRILEDSLGGNCKTAMIAMVSPALDAFSETLSTLKFANRAKSMQNRAFVNEDVDKNSLLRKYERELKRLRKELRQRSQSVVDQRVVLELEDQKRRAEEDKMAALRALESRSFEFMREKQAKRKLEERISELESRMLVGGHLNEQRLQEMPQFRMAINEHREKIRKEYELKMDELDKERQQIEAQRAQVDRYKQLLLKQRDIMVALTHRLNERDDQIVALQDELDELDKAQNDTQELLDNKTSQLIHFQRVSMELEERLAEAEKAARSAESKLEAANDQARAQASAANNTSDPSSAAQIGLEARVRALTSQYQTFRDEMTGRLNAKDARVRQLEEENRELRSLGLGGSVSSSSSSSPQEPARADNHSPSSLRSLHESSGDQAHLFEELDRLRQRSLNHAKEQVAMRTILEKLNLLALNALSEPDAVAPPAMQPLRALSSLVAASLNALQDASPA